MQYDNIATKLSVANYIANGNGRSVYDIAEHFGISTRTVYRILARLQDEGCLLTNEVMRNGKEKLWTMFRWDKDEFGMPIPSSEFTDEERIILYYILGEMKKNEEIIPAFSSVRTKLSNMLSQKAISFPSIDYPERLRNYVYPIEITRYIAKDSSK